MTATNICSDFGGFTCGSPLSSSFPFHFTESDAKNHKEIILEINAKKKMLYSAALVYCGNLT